METTRLGKTPLKRIAAPINKSTIQHMVLFQRREWRQQLLQRQLRRCRRKIHALRTLLRKWKGEQTNACQRAPINLAAGICCTQRAPGGRKAARVFWLRRKCIEGSPPPTPHLRKLEHPNQSHKRRAVFYSRFSATVKWKRGEKLRPWKKTRKKFNLC